MHYIVLFIYNSRTFIIMVSDKADLWWLGMSWVGPGRGKRQKGRINKGMKILACSKLFTISIVARTPLPELIKLCTLCVICYI